ncbi:MAG TPA: hypothetical protein VIC56_09725 [Gemmatimonadota bacterium]|jgi:hypothetical protein
MRTTRPFTRACGCRPPGGRLLLAALLAIACSGDGENLVGTPREAEFDSCRDELAALAESRNADGTPADILVIEEEREGGRDVWGVELSNGVEIEFDAATCEVLEIEHGDDDSGGDDDGSDDDGEDDD